MLQCVCHTHSFNVVKFQEIYIGDGLILQFLSIIEFKVELQRIGVDSALELISENLEI